MSGSRRSSTTQSNGAALHASRALPCRCAPPRSRCPRGRAVARSLALDVVVLDHQQPLGARRVKSTMRSNAVSSPSVVGDLTRYEKAPCESPCWRSSSALMICTGMWRVRGSSFRLLSTVQPSMSGRKMSSVMAVGRNWRARPAPIAPSVGDDALEALVAGQAEQHPRVVRIVLDDEQHAVALRDLVAVVRDLLFALDRQHGSAASGLAAARRPAPSALSGPA